MNDWNTHGPWPGAGEARSRADLLDMVEGLMSEGLSLSGVARIARAGRSGFWTGAAIGAGAAMLARRPELRSAAAALFRDHRQNVRTRRQR